MLYQNLLIALRIACTLPVTVVSAEMSFPELKLIKTYLGPTTAVALININREVGSQLCQDSIIDDFESRKATRKC